MEPLKNGDMLLIPLLIGVICAGMIGTVSYFVSLYVGKKLNYQAIPTIVTFLMCICFGVLLLYFISTRIWPEMSVF